MQIHHGLADIADYQNGVVTIGSFDGVHKGHRKLLTFISQLANKQGLPSVVVTFEPHPRIALGQGKDLKLINTIAEKTHLLSACGIDHLIIIPFDKAFAEQSAETYIRYFLAKQLKAKHLVIGYDHRFGQGRKGDLQLLKQETPQYGIEVHEIEAFEIDEIEISSTKIRQAIQRGDIALANEYLGQPFLIGGLVEKGAQLGRTIGYPTANIALPPDFKLLPPVGIYVAQAQIDGKQVKGMLYLGHRPTIEDDNRLSIEINLLDFAGDLYGQYLELEVLHYLRGDMKFNGLAPLQAQLKQDELHTRAYFDQKVSKKIAQTAVVILNYNTQKHLAQYLPTVLAHLPQNAEIIIADNASPDDSVAWLKTNYPQIRLIKMTQNTGYAAGYNEALKQVESEYLLLINSDIEVKQPWIEQLTATLDADPSIGMAQPIIRSAMQPELFEHAGAAGGMLDYLGYPFCRGRVFDTLEPDKGQYDTEPADIFWSSGATFIVRRSVFEGLGGFDETFFAHMEEIDLCWRAQRAGYRVVICPQSKVWHLGGGTLNYQSPRKTYLNFRNNLATLTKNLSLVECLWIIPARLVLDGLAGLQLGLGKGWGHTFAVVKAHWHYFGRLPAIINQAKRDRIAIKKLQIGPDRTKRSPYSLVWLYFVRQLKTYDSLPKQ
jgi:riboflavin kinase/FMN adenylyltransferase